MKHSLATRYSLLIAIITALIGGGILLVNLYYLNYYSEQSTQDSQRQLIEALEDQIIRDAELVAGTLAGNLDVYVYNSDFSAIQEQLESLSEEGEVLYSYISDDAGLILHDGSAQIDPYGKSVDQYLPADIPTDLTPFTRKIGSYVHIAQPIKSGDNTFAMLRLAISYTHAEEDIKQFSQSLANNAERLQDNISHTVWTLILILLFLATIMVFIISQQLLSPLQMLAKRCRQYAEGDKQTQFDLERQDEIGELGDALEEMKSAIAESQSQIEQLAYLDPLTHLPNRRMFNEELESLIAWTDRHDSHLAVIFIDLDHFKDVNDTAGHDIGDQLLKMTADRLSLLLHSHETLPDFPVLGDLLLSRLGGDEFVMLLPAYKDKSDVEGFCQLIRNRLEEGFIIENHHFHISASLGITYYPENAHNGRELLRQADIAMYAAKDSGRRGYQVYRNDMESAVNRDIALIQQFRLALENDQLYLDYQPIHNLETGQLVGAEALLRWQHPEQGLVKPDDFVPVIEKTELITPLTLWVLNQACNDLSNHLLRHYPEFNLSVNVSGAALEDESIREKVSQIINFYNLPRHQLHLEITETSMMENVERCAKILYEWKNAGTDIWIDDFGTGYSSLNYLHNLPIDGLKVDRSFISSISTHQQSQIIETIVALGSSLNIKTIAEGIETEVQRDRLHDMGCRYGQGNLFSKPLPLRPLIAKLAKKTVNASS